jgi:HPt (histidine-containing phosphotransfer) domain-containing protein
VSEPDQERAMAQHRQDKDEKPSIVNHGDHQIITPPDRLRKAIAPAFKNVHEETIARAEEALAQLSGEFAAWMSQECERLDKARCEMRDNGVTKATREALFHAAHDIKGEAATFGFPAVAAPAKSLCRLIEHTPDMQRLPIALIDQHVDAMRAIVREHTRPGIDQLADTLTRRLREVTDEFLAHENRDRPDVLESILAPPLSPGEPF